MPSTPVILCLLPGRRGGRSSPAPAAASYLPKLNSPQTKKEAHLGKGDLVSHSMSLLLRKCTGLLYEFTICKVL